MVDRIETAFVELWGETVGAVAWYPEQAYGEFEYTPAFAAKGFEIAPLTMPVRNTQRRKYAFRELPFETYKGLPGVLADALPDKFGNAIIDAWLARQQRASSGFSPIERLCYTGRRGVGALEFNPAIDNKFEKSVGIEVAALVSLTQRIMQSRENLTAVVGVDDRENEEALTDILRVGTSAGGARPKAVIALDDAGHVRSGQVAAPSGYEHWIIKFDGVNDVELGKPNFFGRIEYAYFLMAQDCGIEMMPCRLLEENGRAHFMTKRFDRVSDEKLHVLSLCGIAHYDFNAPGSYSYEQLFNVMRRLKLTKAEAMQQYRRMLFNVLARNQDDHTKNISFIMDKSGGWRLSPAYDVNYAHNPAGQWTNQHQMTIAGKRDNFSQAELVAVGDAISIKKPGEIVAEIADSVGRWHEFARIAGVPKNIATDIARHHVSV